MDPACTSEEIEDLINTSTPIRVPFSAKYKQSFAYATLKERIPAILNNFAEGLCKDKNDLVKKFGQEAERDLQAVLKSLSTLGNEINLNKPLIPLTTSRSDVPLWNKLLEDQAKKEGGDLKWYSTVFLYWECYLYRRLKQIFELSENLQNFDYFQKVKESSLINTLDSCALFASYLIKKLNKADLLPEEVKKEAIRLMKLNLWGNRFDMSISLGVASSSSDNPMELVDSLEEFILVDDTEKIWNKLAEIRNANKTIDFVNDNSGYEIFADLCLADFLLTFGFASKIRFNLKSIPWYVSDALEDDVKWTVDILSEMGSHSASLPELSKRWKSYLDSDRLELTKSDFWTLPYEYCMMQKIDPKLHEKLSASSLLFFKGDLNYRKLLADLNWPSTESFSTALQGFQPTCLVAVRTIKAEVVCGLKPGVAEALSAKNPKWNTTGDYGLVQYSGKS
ncbi:damage-control phosphatase ARMT1-like [Bacillus rossius redtenbacheri]|uniref:damage-control phosphatase ARMT1-like n=1 Tax=Bacillus rossius redtenbacheri TaxID=93214 RepID=UPI002FDE34E8